MDSAHRRRLFGIQPQSFARYGIGGPPVDGFRCKTAKLTVPFGTQRLHGAFVERQFRNLMTPDFPLAQRRQRLLLLWRALQGVDIDGQPLFGGKPEPLGRGAGGLSLTQ